jgi:hypothetical protein
MEGDSDNKERLTAEERVEEVIGNSNLERGAFGSLEGQPSPQTKKILELLSGGGGGGGGGAAAAAFKEEDAQISELLTKVRESITEISANSKPRKRARLRDSVDWTIEDIGLEHLEAEEKQPTDMEIVETEQVEVDSSRHYLSKVLTATERELAASTTEEGQQNLGSFALNAVVVLAKEALRRSGERQNSKVLQDTLENMHLQYTTLANECTCLQGKLKNEKETCSVLEKDVQRIHSGLTQLQGENEHLKGALQNLETQVQCQICYEEKRNCVLMPCLHFLFCAKCIDQHFQASENGHRLCPICRQGVSGVLMMQLE